MLHTRTVRAALAVLTGASIAVMSVGATLAHEVRELGDHTFVIGFIDEPVYIGSKSGLELQVVRTADEEPVEGLETALSATVTQAGVTRELTLSPRFGEAGWYESYFIPTVAGSYTFDISGEIEGAPIDESFTSGPDTFGEPQALAAAQFPIQLPAQGEIAEQARRGAEAAGQVTIAMVLGGLGLVAGLAALGLALGARRTA